MPPEPNNPNIQPSYEEGISYQQIIYILKNHQRMIVLITGIVLLLTLFYTSLQKSVYKSTGIIIIDDGGKGMNVFDMSSYGGEQNYLSNEIEILQSRTTAERTVDKLLNSDYRNNLYLFGTRKYEYPWIKYIPWYDLFETDKKPR